MLTRRARGQATEGAVAAAAAVVVTVAAVAAVAAVAVAVDAATDNKHQRFVCVVQ